VSEHDDLADLETRLAQWMAAQAADEPSPLRALEPTFRLTRRMPQARRGVAGVLPRRVGAPGPVSWLLRPQSVLALATLAVVLVATSGLIVLRGGTAGGSAPPPTSQAPTPTTSATAIPLPGGGPVVTPTVSSSSSVTPTSTTPTATPRRSLAPTPLPTRRPSPSPAPTPSGGSSYCTNGVPLQPDQVLVTITRTGFDKPVLTEPVGSWVLWLNCSGVAASVNSDPYPTNGYWPWLNLGQVPANVDSVVEVQLATAGTFTYHNEFTPSQTGKLVVTP